MLKRLLVVGGGQMGQALVGGLLRSGSILPEEIAIAERHSPTLGDLKVRFGGCTVSETAVPAESAVLAVKPGDVADASKALAGTGVSRVVSIVAGVRIAELQQLLGPSIVVLRAMPNLPAVVGQAASALSGGDGVGEEDFAWAEAVLSSFGVVARVPEPLLDAVTGLSGSGPGYVLLLAEALADAGVALGLDREVSLLLASHTLTGTARLLTELGETPEELRARVTSPGGTTAAGLRELERRGFRAAIAEAVSAAANRSRELGETPG